MTQSVEKYFFQSHILCEINFISRGSLFVHLYFNLYIFTNKNTVHSKTQY